MQQTPGKGVRRGACILELKRFLQVDYCRGCFYADTNHLQLKCFSMQAPILDFGSLKVGISRSLELLLANPDHQQQVVPS